MKTERKFNILLVDDDDTFCELVREVLVLEQSISQKVILSRLSDGQDAIDGLAGAVESNDLFPWPDLILLDQRMPKLDGTEALRRIRAGNLTRHIPTCMLSSSGQDRLVRDAYREGANFFLVKPFELEELRVKLTKIVDFFLSVAELPTGLPRPLTVGFSRKQRLAQDKASEQTQKP